MSSSTAAATAGHSLAQLWADVWQVLAEPSGDFHAIDAAAVQCLQSQLNNATSP